MTDDARRRSRLINEAPFAVALDDVPRSITLLNEVEAESSLLQMEGCGEACQASTYDDYVERSIGEVIRHVA